MQAISKASDGGEIASYYDRTLERRLRDYVYGNKRIDAAIELVCSHVRARAERVLEVGCGLGISAEAVARRKAHVEVRGIDISPETIAGAERLFGGCPRLRFKVGDMSRVPEGAPYDVITMLDVHEHIPREQWPRFHDVLGEALSESGTVVLTFPSALHQKHLAENHPSEIQIVDETITLGDIVSLASRIAGEITYYRAVSVWNRYDYVHCVIDRDYRFERDSAGPASGLGLAEAVSSRLLKWKKAARERGRRKLVIDKLGLRV
jgi:cyclopropane fatty-acyl-phospholipid synthase-like methyltransferase